MKLKKLSAALLAAVLVVSSFAACGGSDAGSTTGDAGSSAPAGTESGATAEEKIAASGVQQVNVETGLNTTKSDETLVVELGSYPDNLWHPFIEGTSTGTEESIISGVIFDQLIRYDQTTKSCVPGLAESWECDGNDITFKIRQGVKMYDGSELTADDVVYSIGLWQKNAASVDTGKYIESFEKVDDTTVKVTFNVPAVAMTQMLTWSNFGIVSEDEVNAVGGLEAANKNPLTGCGKYHFKDAKVGEYVIVERNEDYWDTNYTAYFKEIKFIFVSDSNAAIQAVQAGDAQAADCLPNAQVATFANDESVRAYVYPNGEIEHIQFNMAEGHPTSDIKVRQAIAKLVNYEALAAVNSAGFGEVALSYFDPSASYYVEGWTKDELANDVEGAKALLAEAGYDDSNPLTVTVYTLPDQLELYTVLQANLALGGVTLDIQQVDMGGFVPALLLDKSYDLVIIGDDTSYKGPQCDQFVAPGMCFGGYGMPLEDHDAILDKLIASTSDEEAKAAAVEYMELLKTDYAALNLCQNFHSGIVAGNIKGYTTRERGYLDVTFLYK